MLLQSRLFSVTLIISNWVMFFFDQHVLRVTINTFYLVAILLSFLLSRRKLPAVHNRYYSLHNQTTEPRRHVEMYASAVRAFTHLYTADGALW